MAHDEIRKRKMKEAMKKIEKGKTGRTKRKYFFEESQYILIK